MTAYFKNWNFRYYSEESITKIPSLLKNYDVYVDEIEDYEQRQNKKSRNSIIKEKLKECGVFELSYKEFDRKYRII